MRCGLVSYSFVLTMNRGMKIDRTFNLYQINKRSKKIE